MAIENRLVRIEDGDYEGQIRYAPTGRPLTAQFLYDLRDVTGFISGTDLHDLFRALLNDPFPSGTETIDLDKAERLCPELTAELDSSLAILIDRMAQYTGQDFGHSKWYQSWGPDRTLRRCPNFVAACRAAIDTRSVLGAIV